MLKAEISSQGLNDREFSVKKPKDVYRIAVVGDSVSFGWKVKPKESFPKIIEDILNKREERKYEVINFSVPGYNTAQEYELIKKKVLKFEPDAVLLVYCGNDMNLCNFIQPKLTPMNFLYVKSFYIHKLLRKFDRKFRVDKKEEKLVDKAWPWFKKNILGMYYYKKRIYNSPGLEVASTINCNPPGTREMVPKRYWYMLGPERYEETLSKISSMLQAKDVRLISSGWITDLGTVFNKRAGIEEIYSFNEIFDDEEIYKSKYVLSEKDTHLNPDGHDLIAEYLYKKIMAVTKQ